MKLVVRQIEAYRKRNGLSQEEMARKLRVSLATYRNWIKGRTDPSPMAMEKLERFLRRIRR